jgi:RNA polymerase sigma-70 factor (ECF subfamily)
MVSSSSSHDPAAELLGRWQQNQDPDALDELLQLEIGTLADRLRHKAGGQLRPSVSASDLAQEAVFRMLRKEEPPEFEAPGQFRAYLWKSAWRLLLNRLGKTRARRLSEIESQEVGLGLFASGLGKVEEEERNLALELALNLLKAEDREILELVYFQHLDVPAAAEKLALSRGAAEMRLTRARRRLAKKLCNWVDLIR